MAGDWDNENTRAHAARIKARLERPRLDPREPSRGTLAAEWFLLRSQKGDIEPIEVGTAEPPGSIRSAMNQCQKPFQLWNVTRIDDQRPARFEPGPRYSIGAAGAPGERPMAVTPASRAARREADEAEMIFGQAFGWRREKRQLLSEDGGFGLPDPTPNEG
jgi:hypothetical protein